MFVTVLFQGNAKPLLYIYMCLRGINTCTSGNEKLHFSFRLYDATFPLRILSNRRNHDFKYLIILLFLSVC